MRCVKLTNPDSISFKNFHLRVENSMEITEKENKKSAYNIAENTDYLSKREIKILKQICLGYSTDEIASFEKLSPRTVETHLANLLDKSGSQNSADLLLYALRTRIVVAD
jgi:DNA-binding CsgD family transcriptional regulator